jgi:hypothetical protein
MKWKPTVKIKDMNNKLKVFQQLIILIALILLTKNAIAGENTAKGILKDKYLVHDGATCAGWEFKGTTNVERYDEIYCANEIGATYKARVHWLNEKQFMIVQNGEDLLGGTPESRPPRVEIYEFIKFEKSKVYLKEYWTGWGKNQTEILVFNVSRQ